MLRGDLNLLPWRREDWEILNRKKVDTLWLEIISSLVNESDILQAKWLFKTDLNLPPPRDELFDQLFTSELLVQPIRVP